MPSKGTGSSLKGVSTRINGRHAIVRETELRGAVTFRKGDLAQRLGCCERSLDRALTRLRRDEYVVSTPKFSETGAQLGNEYRATPAGITLASRFRRDKQGGYKVGVRE